MTTLILHHQRFCRFKQLNFGTHSAGQLFIEIFIKFWVNYTETQYIRCKKLPVRSFPAQWSQTRHVLEKIKRWIIYWNFQTLDGRRASDESNIVPQEGRPWEPIRIYFHTLFLSCTCNSNQPILYVTVCSCIDIVHVSIGTKHLYLWLHTYIANFVSKEGGWSCKNL